MEKFTLDSRRLQEVQSRWKNLRSTGVVGDHIELFMCLCGEWTPETIENQSGSALIQYLLRKKTSPSNVGVVLTPNDICIVFDNAKCEILISSETLSELNSLPDGKIIKCVTLENFSGILETLVNKYPQSCFGIPRKEIPLQTGSFATSFLQTFENYATLSDTEKVVDIRATLGELLFCKDSDALLSITKASSLCTAAFKKFVRPLIEEQMQKSNPLSLAELSNAISEKLTDPNTLPGLEALDASEFSPVRSLFPAVFHQGAYQVKLHSVDLPSTPLQSNIIVVRYGARHLGQTAFFARTLIVSSKSPSNVSDAYSFLVQVSAKVIELLTPGTSVSQVYAKTLEFAQSLDSELSKYLMNNMGFATGLLVLEPRGQIGPKGTITVENGMSFVVRVILENVPESTATHTNSDGAAENEQSVVAHPEPFSIELSDTINIENGAGVLKTKATKDLNDILYSEDIVPADNASFVLTRELSAITRQGKTDHVIVSLEAKRIETLQALLLEKQAEFANGGGREPNREEKELIRSSALGRLGCEELDPYPAEGTVAGGSSSSHYVSLASSKCEKVPYVDHDRQTLWVRIEGITSAFHISTISKIETHRSGDSSTNLTISFNNMQQSNPAFQLNRTKIYIKELVLNARRDVFQEVVSKVRDLQRRIRESDTQARNELGIAEFIPIQHVANAKMLREVKMRPAPMNNKSGIGNLELHLNGVRFSGHTGQPIDIPFSNIQHIIFQPAINSICVIYHITLKKPIILGRKKTTELQFVAEVLVASEVASSRRHTYDEELEQEEIDQQRIRATNKEFMIFATEVERMSGIKKQFPLDKFSFDGVVVRGLTTFKASTEVLWAVSDFPPFTMRVEDIELVSFERVTPGVINFDMNFIPKTYRDPICITNVSRSQLEFIKDWCLRVKLYYIESKLNLSWKNLLEEIRGDEEWNPWDIETGWAVMNAESDSEGDDDTDSTYATSSSESAGGSDDSWSSEQFTESSEISTASSEGEDDSFEDSDEMEKKTGRHDKRQAFRDDRNNATSSSNKRARGENQRHSGFPGPSGARGRGGVPGSRGGYFKPL